MTAKPNIERTDACKNCGSKDHLEFKMKTNPDKSVNFTISCTKCGAIISDTCPSRDRAKTTVIRRWNEMTEDEFKSRIGLRDQIIQTTVKTDKPRSHHKKSDSEEVITVSGSKFSWFKLAKEDMLEFANMLISRYNKSNPKEECPVTVGDLLRLFGMKEEEIFKVLPKVKFSKEHIKSYEDMISALNSGKNLYYIDEFGRTWKYSPLRQYLSNDISDMIQSLKSAGLTTKNTFISK